MSHVEKSGDVQIVEPRVQDGEGTRFLVRHKVVMDETIKLTLVYQSNYQDLETCMSPDRRNNFDSLLGIWAIENIDLRHDLFAMTVHLAAGTHAQGTKLHRFLCMEAMKHGMKAPIEARTRLIHNLLPLVVPSRENKFHTHMKSFFGISLKGEDGGSIGKSLNAISGLGAAISRIPGHFADFGGKMVEHNLSGVDDVLESGLLL